MRAKMATVHSEDTTGRAWRHVLTSPIAWALLAGAAFLILIIVFPLVSDDLTEISGVPCDIPAEGAHRCVHVASSDDKALGTQLEATDRPFVRVSKPRSEIFVWSTLAAFAVVGSATAAAVAIGGRRSSNAVSAPGRSGLKAALGIPISPLTMTFGLAIAVAAALSRQYVQAAVVFTLWTTAGPSIAAVSRCWTISRTLDWMPGAERSARMDTLTELGRLHERFVALLGAQVTLYILWLSADVRLKGAIAETELAQQGGDFLNSPHDVGLVVLWGAFFTGLLAIAYFPIATRIRHHAAGLIGDVVGGLRDDGDFAKFNQQRLAVASVLGTDQPLQARFQSAVVIAAPLLTSLLSSGLSR